MSKKSVLFSFLLVATLGMGSAFAGQKGETVCGKIRGVASHGSGGMKIDFLPDGSSKSESAYESDNLSVNGPLVIAAYVNGLRVCFSDYRVSTGLGSLTHYFNNIALGTLAK